MNSIKLTGTKKAMLMAGMVLLMLSPVTVFATGGALTGLTSLTNFFSGLVRLAGVMIVIYGISVFGPGFSQHDATGIRTGIMIIIGGVVMLVHM